MRLTTVKVPKAIFDAIRCVSAADKKSKAEQIMTSMLVNMLFDMTHRDAEVKRKILPMLRDYYDEIEVDAMTGEHVQDYIQGLGILVGSGPSDRTEDSYGEGDSGDTEGTVSGST